MTIIRAVVLVGLGYALVVAGIAFIYWPAAIIFAGLGAASLGLYIDIPAEQQQSSAKDEVQTYDETDAHDGSPSAIVARIRG